MLDVSNEKYQTRKNIKQNTTVQLVFQLTKNETITNHIMSYLVNTTHYDYIKNTVHFEVLHELQLFELDTYAIIPNTPTDTTTIPNKERMLSINNYLLDHPITSKKIISYNMFHTLEANKEYCSNWLFNVNDNKHCYKHEFTGFIVFWFRNCDKERLEYSYN